MRCNRVRGKDLGPRLPCSFNAKGSSIESKKKWLPVVPQETLARSVIKTLPPGSRAGFRYPGPKVSVNPENPKKLVHSKPAMLKCSKPNSDPKTDGERSEGPTPRTRVKVKNGPTFQIPADAPPENGATISICSTTASPHFESLDYIMRARALFQSYY